MKRIMLVGSYLATSILAVGLSGCSDNAAPTAGNLSLTIASSGVVAKAAKAAAADTFAAGGDTLVVTGVQVVLREVELQASDDAGADSTRVEEFEAGPLLVDLPLGGATDQVVSVDVTPGTYNEVEFKVDSVRSDEGSSAAFLAAHPGFDGVSVRVTGTFNGTAFTFTSGLESEQEHDLVPALVVAEGGGAMNLTLSVDHTSWFAASGGGLIDPATAGVAGPNREQVEHNIKQSFDSFEDDNHDGHED
jgi:hypothetical protein